MHVLLLIGCLSLTACETGLSDLRGIGPGLVKSYGADFLAQAADELEDLPEGSALAAMIADYRVLRAQLRAAN